MRIHRKKNGFTLIDMLICVAGMSIVMTVIVSVGKEVRSRAHSTICMNNLRQISFAMANYYADYEDYPRGLPYDTLKNQLDSYIRNELVFLCPIDRYEDEDSYSQYYVYRGDDMSAFKYVMGCPRHRDYKSTTNIFSLQNAKSFNNADVLANNENVMPGSFVSGTIKLEDGSTITSQSVDMIVIQSMRLANGVLYSVVRVPEGESGQVVVNATPGTKLEVVTPSIVAGVRGTTYTLDIGYRDNFPYTEINVQSGVVAVVPLAGMFNNSSESELDLVSAGKQEILLRKEMGVQVFTKSLPIRQDEIHDRIIHLRHKIEKRKKADLPTEPQEKMLEWLSQMIDTSVAPVIEPAASEQEEQEPAEEEPQPEDNSDQGDDNTTEAGYQTVQEAMQASQVAMNAAKHANDQAKFQKSNATTLNVAVLSILPEIQSHYGSVQSICNQIYANLNNGRQDVAHNKLIELTQMTDLMSSKLQTAIQKTQEATQAADSALAEAQNAQASYALINDAKEQAAAIINGLADEAQYQEIEADLERAAQDSGEAFNYFIQAKLQSLQATLVTNMINSYTQYTLGLQSQAAAAVNDAD